MPDYFFDTSVLVAYFKNEDSRSAALVEAVINGQATAAISAITIAELWAVKQQDVQARRRQQAVLQLMQSVPVDTPVAERGGLIRQIHDLQLPDALVAACCQVVGGRFFSKDPHFRRMLDQHEIIGEIYP